jgi:hypothetical protein
MRQPLNQTILVWCLRVVLVAIIALTAWFGTRAIRSGEFTITQGKRHPHAVYLHGQAAYMAGAGLLCLSAFAIQFLVITFRGKPSHRVVVMAIVTFLAGWVLVFVARSMA